MMKFAFAAFAALLVSTPALAQPADHAAMAMPAAGTVQGTGTVKSVNPKAGTITLDHGPIAALKWPAMTMSFKASADVLKGAKAGQNVTFTLNPANNEVVALQSK